ncbi:MAG TPA: helix-hairpin-helix domain-containing protein [Longimicrobiales bacterium]|nr:helix-hairpin-helix domain-containing protein [Longimicrobiales bacterium]
MVSTATPTAEKTAALRDIRRIPGIGASLSEDLWDLGMRRVEDLRGRDPEELYARLCTRAGMRLDPCVLYAFRCAVYFASHDVHDPALLKWWNWKGRSSELAR